MTKTKELGVAGGGGVEEINKSLTLTKVTFKQHGRKSHTSVQAHNQQVNTHPANAGQLSAKNSPTNVLVFVVCEVGCSRELLLPVVFPLLGTIVFTAIQLFAADCFCRR